MTLGFRNETIVDNSLFTNIQVIFKLGIVHDFRLCMAMEVLGNSHQGASTSGRLCVLVLYSSRAEKCCSGKRSGKSGNVVLLYFIGFLWVWFEEKSFFRPLEC